jgi:hypothetical protein
VSDSALFVLIFGGIFALRIMIATIAFFFILPRGDRCPNCDHPTLRVSSLLFDRVMPWFRKSWCITCGWHGLLRRGEVTESAHAREPSGKR